MRMFRRQSCCGSSARNKKISFAVWRNRAPPKVLQNLKMEKVFEEFWASCRLHFWFSLPLNLKLFRDDVKRKMPICTVEKFNSAAAHDQGWAHRSRLIVDHGRFWFWKWRNSDQHPTAGYPATRPHRQGQKRTHLFRWQLRNHEPRQGGLHH